MMVPKFLSHFSSEVQPPIPTWMFNKYLRLKLLLSQSSLSLITPPFSASFRAKPEDHIYSSFLSHTMHLVHQQAHPVLSAPPLRHVVLHNASCHLHHHLPPLLALIWTRGTASSLLTISLFSTEQSKS